MRGMPGTVQGVTLAILFIVPGFVLGSVYNRNLAQPAPTDARFVILSLFFSVLNHLVLSPWTVRIYEQWQLAKLLEYRWEFVAWLFSAVIFVPVVLGLTLSQVIEAPRLQPLLKRLGYSSVDRTQTCWDLFAQHPWDAWVIVGLNDGTNIAGKFGRNSYVARTPPEGSIPRDIFIEEVWLSDGNTFGDKVPNTRGAWINGADIRWIKFLRE